MIGLLWKLTTRRVYTPLFAFTTRRVYATKNMRHCLVIVVWYTVLCTFTPLPLTRGPHGVSDMTHVLSCRHLSVYHDSLQSLGCYSLLIVRYLPITLSKVTIRFTAHQYAICTQMHSYAVCTRLILWYVNITPDRESMAYSSHLTLIWFEPFMPCERYVYLMFHHTHLLISRQLG